MDILEFNKLAFIFGERIKKIKEAAKADFDWYPWSIISNIAHLEVLLKPPYRDLSSLLGSGRVLDIGCADGDLGFIFESLGLKVDFLDNAGTNYNSLKGLKYLHAELDSKGEIFEQDVDSQFVLKNEYDLVLCLGILYHIKNPFYFLETLASNSRYCLLSTRIFKVTADLKHNLSDVPVSYLVGPTETNNDSTNYWIFTDCGLRRILERAGWRIIFMESYGTLIDSNPSSMDKDERAFCLLESLRHSS